MHAFQYIYNAFNTPVDALPLQIGVGVSIAVSFTFSQSFMTLAILPFLCFCELSFQRSHRETLNSSMTFDFSVGVCISNLFFIIGLFKCFCGWGRIRFYEDFQFAFPRLSLVGCKNL